VGTPEDVDVAGSPWRLIGVYKTTKIKLAFSYTGRFKPPIHDSMAIIFTLRDLAANGQLDSAARMPIRTQAGKTVIS
jgi:hypothetical protein